MIDQKGYRLNVGIILSNQEGKLLWAKRVGQDAWQFPQGGIKPAETPKQALFRELREEIGLTAQQVKIIGYTKRWLSYRLPNHLIRYYQKPVCIGQKQVWYLLRILSSDNAINLEEGDVPEFDHWQWVDYWKPLEQVVYFKRRVYEMALQEFEPLIQRKRIYKVVLHSK